MTDDKSLVDAYASIYNKKEKEIEQVDEAIFTGAALAGKALLGAGKKFLMNKAKDAAMGMAKRGLGMLNPNKDKQPQPAMASYQPEGEMVEDVAITHLDGSTTEIIDVVTPPPLGNKEEDQEALHNRLWDQVTANLTTLGEMDDTRYLVEPIEEKKKLDPVGKEDGDVDNDGDKDSSDSYLLKRRMAIKKAMKKEEVVVEGGDGDPCWDSHKQVGMKKKGGKMVPNCVPKNESFNIKSPVSFTKPEKKVEEGISEDQFKKHSPAILEAHWQMFENRKVAYNPEKYGEKDESEMSFEERRKKRMNDPHKGINSPAFKKFMRDRGM